jgi:hypothetical protein
VVECFLAKEDVAGSTPVSRSKSSCLRYTSPTTGQKHRSPSGARYPSGKGEVCKTFMRRFDPDPRLQIPQQLSSSGFQTGCHFGCQLTDNPLRSSLIRALQSRRLCAEALAEGCCRLVRRSVEDMSVELEKNIGAGVT